MYVVPRYIFHEQEELEKGTLEGEAMCTEVGRDNSATSQMSIEQRFSSDDQHRLPECY